MPETARGVDGDLVVAGSGAPGCAAALAGGGGGSVLLLEANTTYRQGSNTAMSHP